MRFYKFRSVGEDLVKDHALDGLINSYAIFSSRTNFNDLFDSKIQIPRPTPKQIEDLMQVPGIGSQASTIRSWVSAGKFTPVGLSALNTLETGFNEMIDRYPIYCLSNFNDNDLLWAHYASSHTGICIEFEFPENQPTEVHYREHLESIPLLDFIKPLHYFGSADLKLANRIHEALHVKRNHWAYEGEYRWIAGNGMGQLSKGSKFMKVPYDPIWVKAIIFGCRTSDEVKAYIKSNLPFSTDFKQAIEVKDRIEVVPES
jgi:hypothetical protein